jgi:hypothetical protein
MLKLQNGKHLRSVVLSALITGSLVACFFFRPPKLFAQLNCSQGNECYTAGYPNDYGTCGGPEEDGNCGCEYSDDTYVDSIACQAGQ